MASTKEDVLEPHARHIGNGSMLFINTDASWSVGRNVNNLVKVSFGATASIDDTTFGFSAVAVESDGKGGWRLFVRSDEQNDTIVAVNVAANGQVDPASVGVLTREQLWQAENQYKIDLNDNGGFGDEPVLLQGGVVNLYADAVGAYQVGTGGGAPVTLKLGGQALTDEVLPPGWDIVEVVPGTSGALKVFAQSPQGAVFAADFSATGDFTGGAVLTAAELEALEVGGGLDIDGDGDLPAPAGWTSVLTDPKIRQWVDAAIAPAGPSMSALSATGAGEGAHAQPQNVSANGMSYAELVAMLQGMIKSHQDAGNTPISAAELASLQALAARGKAAFTGPTQASVDYLTSVFGKLVSGSDANRFFNGGTTTRSELGSLGSGSSLDQFQRLVSKWILGGDMPSPATGGDSATGKAQSVTAVYAQSTGSLFVEGVALADVNQGSAGDCYLIAVLGALAGTKPTAIEAMVVENTVVDGTRSWGVRFFDAAGKAHWVTVNDMLPTRPDDNAKLAYAGSADKSLNGEIWVPLVEKAYAQANTLGILPRAESRGHNSYAGVEGGQGDPLAQLLGGKVTQYSVVADAAAAGPAQVSGNDFLTAVGVHKATDSQMATLKTTLMTAINSGQTIWIGVTTTQRDSFGNQLLVGSHAHFAVDADPTSASNETVLVYNPWGQQAAANPPGPVASQFLSPVPYTLTELIGITGLDFGVLVTAGG